MSAIDSIAYGDAASVSPRPDTAVAWRQGPPLPSGRATSVPALIAECLSHFPDVPVLRDGERTATWRDLDAWSGRLAASWADFLPRGARCAILLSNGLPHLLAEMACWRLGAIAAPVFLGFGPARLRELLERLDAQLVIVDDPIIAHALPADLRRQSTGDLWRNATRRQGPPADRAVEAADPCLIQFTSGSTGVPRGVVLTHDNLASQQAAFALHWPEVGPGDRLSAYLPWHHSFGGLAERWWSLCRGADLTVVPGGGRDRSQLLATIRRVAPTVFLSVPKIHALMVEERLFSKRSLRWAFTAGAPMPDAVRLWYTDQEIPICEGWGLTETSPSCTLTHPGPGHGGVVGWPIAGVEVGVRQADGHILVRGPNVMAGYLGQSGSTWLSDGSFDTGDLGAWSSAGLCLRGRADHQLKLGNGEKVCAATLEAVMEAHPAIHQVVVAAEPGLLAIIELRPGHDAQEVVNAVRALNANQEVPYQRITEIYGVAVRMSVENGYLTASLKVSRGQVLAAFRHWRYAGGSEFIRYQ